MKRVILIVFMVLGSLLCRAEGVVPQKKSTLPRYNYHYTSQDSLALIKMNSRMAEVRRKEHRPTVALVLSGGGAKGFAYVGAIKLIQEKGIPVDMVVGCSMGGLIGGLYAMGYSMEELESMLPLLNWTEIMTDNIPRETLSYAQKKYKDTYNLSLPFYKAPVLSVAASEGDVSSIFGSLPSGYSHGYNVMNLFSALSVGYEGNLDFFDMEVPYSTVALDIMTSRLKVFHNGDIRTAMRSTMSIPGVFTPVKMDNMVLIDGGFMDNFPVSLAKDMGADMVIAIDVGSKSMASAANVNNLVDVMMQYMNSTDREAYTLNRNLVDFYCNPDVYKYGPLSFSDANIRDIIEIGYNSIKKQEAELDSLALVIQGRNKTLKPVERSKRAVNLFTTPVTFGEIVLNGIDSNERQIVEDRIGMSELMGKIREPMSKADIDKIITALMSLDTFETVTYEVVGSEEPYTLVINCVKGPIHHLGAAVRFDTEEVVSVGLHLGLNYHKLKGSKLDFAAKVSMNPSIEARYSLTLPDFPTINASLSGRYTNADVFANNENLLGFTYLGTNLKVYLSDINLSVFDFQLGFRNSYYDIKKYLSSTTTSSEIPREVHLFAPFAKLFYNTQDDRYFPHKGMVASFTYNWNIATLPGQSNNYHTLYLELGGVVNIADNIDLIPSFYNRFIIGTNPVILDVNTIGGRLAGRYVPQQIPFMGINTIVAQDMLLTVGSLEARISPHKDVYLSAVTSVARSASDFNTFFYNSSPAIWGAGVELGYDSIIGPCVFNVHWNSFDRRVGVYLGLGYAF